VASPLVVLLVFLPYPLLLPSVLVALSRLLLVRNISRILLLSNAELFLLWSSLIVSLVVLSSVLVMGLRRGLIIRSDLITRESLAISIGPGSLPLSPPVSLPSPLLLRIPVADARSVARSVVLMKQLLQQLVVARSVVNPVMMRIWTILLVLLCKPACWGDFVMMVLCGFLSGFRNNL
jgi:hypothetical protein